MTKLEYERTQDTVTEIGIKSTQKYNPTSERCFQAEDIEPEKISCPDCEEDSLARIDEHIGGQPPLKGPLAPKLQGVRAL